MFRFCRKAMSAIISSALVFLTISAHAQHASQPGSRTLMDAHNCYPYFEWWSDRIDRALSAGTPLAIEQDLGWYTNPKTGKSWSVVTHGNPSPGKSRRWSSTFSRACGLLSRKP